jgi:hypothetical protein
VGGKSRIHRRVDAQSLPNSIEIIIHEPEHRGRRIVLDLLGGGILISTADVQRAPIRYDEHS